ncbi:hypothetical protein F5144DRAFT_381251 [Chaetomium tenue]|uniref:Uncharacterized protein n=1 Tax=Chaetomium tenue TaxID=1854479 RepID=A0ACB7NWH5_9PEZI|nr:hypothetical protein F5144DRAFT_381251 [Chaetomium globosum]
MVGVIWSSLALHFLSLDLFPSPAVILGHHSQACKRRGKAVFWIGYPCSSKPLERDGVQKRLGCFRRMTACLTGVASVSVAALAGWVWFLGPGRRSGLRFWSSDHLPSIPWSFQTDRPRRLEATGVSDVIDKNFSLYLVTIASAGWTGFRLDRQFRTYCLLLLYSLSPPQHGNDTQTPMADTFPNIHSLCFCVY